MVILRTSEPPSPTRAPAFCQRLILHVFILPPSGGGSGLQTGSTLRVLLAGRPGCVRILLIALSLRHTWVPSPGAAVSVAGGLAPPVPGHGAGQHPGQQHLPQESGPEWEQHGGHRRQDAEQGSSDQHHTPVTGAAITAIHLLMVLEMYPLEMYL